jgi:hypothetical protein
MKRGPQRLCPKRASPLHGNCDEYLEWVLPITGLTVQGQTVIAITPQLSIPQCP